MLRLALHTVQEVIHHVRTIQRMAADCAQASIVCMDACAQIIQIIASIAMVLPKRKEELQTCMTPGPVAHADTHIVLLSFSSAYTAQPFRDLPRVYRLIAYTHGRTPACFEPNKRVPPCSVPT
jgi:hypothetical protein